MHSIDDYTGLITTEHRDKALFVAAVSALVQGVMGSANAALGMPDDFDLDRAEGDQLDTIGLWVGINRLVPTQLANIYFSWEDASFGWESGYWKGEFDPSAGLTSVDDRTFRTMIRAKIAANVWDGSLAGMYRVWELVFGANVIFVQDNQDMTMTLIYDTTKLTPVEVQLLTGGYFRMKPSGVKVLYAPLSSVPLFAWDRSSAMFQGWNDVAVWSQ